MKLTVAEKLRIIMNRLNVNMTTLAELSGQSRQNLSNKFSRGNFTEDDIQKLAAALGCEVEVHFVLPDGSEV
jgi:transcriptional regulator with XRE-family HTH domain